MFPAKFARVLVPFSLLGIVALGFMGGSCSNSVPQQQITDQDHNNTQSTALHKKYPYPTSNNSNELANLSARYKRLNDPNHVSYVYLLATGTGDIIAEYQVIGKCTSTESLYSSPVSVVYDQGSAGGGNMVIPAPQPDGSYGQNEQAIFCFIDDANKTLIEFNTQYLWTDNPLPLASPPQIVIVPNGH